MQTKRTLFIRFWQVVAFLGIIILCTYGASASSTSTTVTVGPGSDLGLGYGTFEGAKVLTLNIQPKSGWRIVSSECTDNTGDNIWYRYSSSSTLHVWKTFGVLPNFSTSESHAAVIHGYLAPIGTGDSSSGTPPQFWAKVNDIDADVDALGRHVDAKWSPTTPTDSLAELEDICEEGTSGGLGIPVTDPGDSLPATRPAGTGKALRVRINAKKSGGKLRFSGQGTKLAIYKASSDAETQTKVTDDITHDPDINYYIHTCTGFTATNIIAEYISTQTNDVAKDTVRVYPVIIDYQLFVNTPDEGDDYVPVQDSGRVAITVIRNPATSAEDFKLKDSNTTNPILFYDAKTGGTGEATKSFLMPQDTCSKTYWISGNESGTGDRIIKLYAKAQNEEWDEDEEQDKKKELPVTVVKVDLSATGSVEMTDDWVTWPDGSMLEYFLTPKGGSGDNVTITATISPNTAAIRAALDWVTATEDAGDPLKATVSKGTTMKYPIAVTIGESIVQEAEVWVFWADLVVQIDSNQTIDKGNDAEFLVGDHEWQPSVGGGNKLGVIDKDNVSSLTYAYTVGKMQAKATLAPAGIEEMIPESWWMMKRDLTAKSWDNGGHYDSGLWKNSPSINYVNHDDTSKSYAKDLDPNSGSSERELYDLDGPGCSSVEYANIIHSSEVYANFIQYVSVNLSGNEQECSENKNWSYVARIDIDKGANHVEKNELKLIHVNIPASPHYSARFNLLGTITKNGNGLGGVTVTAGGKSTTTEANGTYTIVGVGVGQLTITPTKEGESFTPTSRNVNLVDKDIDGQDYTSD